MSEPNFPSPDIRHRRADLIVHFCGLILILVAGGALITRAVRELDSPLIWAVLVYVACALASNLASSAYHFLPWPGRRRLLRRIDHAVIYPSISGTFTPFFVQAGTGWTMTLLWVCWGLTALAAWNKITNETVQGKWSTASYLGLGAIGLSALPDLGDVPMATLWCVLAGAAGYVIGVLFYAQKTLPYRYPIWHIWVNVGAICMFAGIWLALF